MGTLTKGFVMKLDNSKYTKDGGITVTDVVDLH